MSRIKHIAAREILDSRGFPTVETDVVLTSGAMGRAAVPSGASTGKHEALELRDGDATRFKGKGVRLAIQQIHQTLAPAVLRKPLPNHRVLDKLLVKLETDREGRKLGANAILSVSLAFERAQAAEARQEVFYHLGGKQARTLPVPQFNVINGGAHANNGLDIQEFMLVPAGAATFSEAVRMGSEVFHELKGILAQRGQSTSVGDEGGFAPKLRSNREALDLLLIAIQGAGYKAGQDIYLALDAAASEFASDTHYKFEGQSLRASDLIGYYKSLVHAYPLISIEDPLAEDDWEGWAELTKALAGRVQIVGDDLFVTQTERLAQGIEESVANAILIKPNQVGNLSGTLDAIRMAQRSSYGTVISHRSGETEDTFIADLAVATRAGQIKTGSLSRSERLAKYNRLLRIEEMLGKRAAFAGRQAIKAKFATVSD